MSERKAFIEARLSACLPPPGARPERLTDAMRYAVMPGGKRLRAILCLAAAEAAGGRAEDAAHAACAVELLHAYTLVHDDLPCMDDDVLRRGLPTVHVKYGEAVAVLAGDALLTLAFEVLARTHEARPGMIARLVSELAVAAGAAGVIGGQVEDIASAAAPTRAAIDYVFQHKTADLFRAAVRLGAIAVQASDETLENLSLFANGLGLAFQVTDDILDASESKSGEKPELSCLDVMSEAEARAWARQLTCAARAAIADLPGDASPLATIADRLLSRVE
ncbi:MAG: polyprenyl synthetase family protein [Kiritimatiellaeota bacterium]|nr:polyprenyl synthetase family protein [Kiritimatiellota bacterium]